MKRWKGWAGIVALGLASVAVASNSGCEADGLLGCNYAKGGTTGTSTSSTIDSECSGGAGTSSTGTGGGGNTGGIGGSSGTSTGCGMTTGTVTATQECRHSCDLCDFPEQCCSGKCESGNCW